MEGDRGSFKMHRPACCDHVRLSRSLQRLVHLQVAGKGCRILAACTTRLESRCGIWSGVHRSGCVPMQLRAVRVPRQGPDDADMSMTACLQQGDPLFVQPLSELFAGMTEAVESTTGSHHQPGSYGCQKVRLEGTVRTVVRRQQDVGLYVLIAGQQVAQGGRIGITGKQSQTVPVPDKTQDQGGAVALPEIGARYRPGRMQHMQGKPVFRITQLQDVSGMEGDGVPILQGGLPDMPHLAAARLAVMQQECLG